MPLAIDPPLFSTTRPTSRNGCWRIGLVAAVLLVLYSGDCVTRSRSQETLRPVQIDQNDWRRTSTGWEQTGNWQPNPLAMLAEIGIQSAGAIHPLLVAALELLVSLAALIHFSPAGTVREKKVVLKSASDEIA